MMDDERFEALKRESKKAGRDSEFAHRAWVSAEEYAQQLEAFEAWVKGQASEYGEAPPYYTGYAARVAKAGI